MDQEMSELFTPSQCLNSQELINYLSGELSDTAKRRIELHLAGCALCSDALEGLASVQPSSRIPEMVSQVNDRIFRHLKHHPRIRKKQQLNILLSLAVFIVLVIILVAYMSFHFAARNVTKSGHSINQSQKK
ncbi:MAG TPA: zf-HC2 domain-containing protein [Chitinophagaceae bacterium]|nr:zf-HC2 domain-containing protein [Chitinophagaceae bacterium]